MGEDNTRIVDPAANFIREQQATLEDFIFRICADPGRAKIMAREACVQVEDDLPSQLSFDRIRVLLFQKAYELNEEAMRPIDKEFFERYHRFHASDKQLAKQAFRWESALLQLGHQATLLLLLVHRFGFSVEAIGEILGREADQLSSDLKILEAQLIASKFQDFSMLASLPKYGFLQDDDEAETALSVIMQGMRNRQISGITLRRSLITLVGLALLGAVGWSYCQPKPERKRMPVLQKKPKAP